MVKVGTIAIDLVAHTGKLLKPLKQAQNAIGGLMSKATKFGAIGAAITAPIAAAFSMQKAISKVTQAFSELGDISDESKRLGIPAEQLTALQYAAKQSGMEIAELGKSLQLMMKGGKSVGELGKIADELDRTADPVKKMQLALKYFGRGGAGMINMLAGGSKSLQEMIDRAGKLGLVVTQIDADKVEIAGDAFADIGNVITGVARRIAVELAPFINWISNKIVDIAIDGGGMGKVVSAAFDWIGRAIANVLDYVEVLKMGWKYAEVGAAWFVGNTVAGFLKIWADIKNVAETIANGFVWAFREAQSAASRFVLKALEAFAWLSGSDTANEFAEAFRDTIEGTTNRVPIKFDFGGEETMQAAKDWKAGTDKRVAELLAQINEAWLSPSWGEAFLKTWNNIKADFEASTLNRKPPPLSTTVDGKRQEVGALVRGSQQAFHAIAATMKKSVEEQQLAVAKKQLQVMEGIERNGFVLKGADL